MSAEFTGFVTIFPIYFTPKGGENGSRWNFVLILGVSWVFYCGRGTGGGAYRGDSLHQLFRNLTAGIGNTQYFSERQKIQATLKAGKTNEKQHGVLP
jgi:hypothetical protein